MLYNKFRSNQYERSPSHVKAILEQADKVIYTGVNQEILKNEWSRRKLPYCTYVPDKAAHMLGFVSLKDKEKGK